MVALINGASHVRKAGRSENNLERRKAMIIGRGSRRVAVLAQVPVAKPTPPISPAIYPSHRWLFPQRDLHRHPALRRSDRPRVIRGRSHRRGSCL